MLTPRAFPQEPMSFESEDDLARIQTQGTKVSLTTDHATLGTHALRIEFLPTTEWATAEWPLKEHTDWSGFGRFALDIANPGPAPVEFIVCFTEQPKEPDAKPRFLDTHALLAPGESATFVHRFAPAPMKYGLRAFSRRISLRGSTGPACCASTSPSTIPPPAPP